MFVEFEDGGRAVTLLFPLVLVNAGLRIESFRLAAIKRSISPSLQLVKNRLFPP